MAIMSILNDFRCFFAFFPGAFISITLEPLTFTHQVRAFYKDETKLFNILQNKNCYLKGNIG